MKISTIVGARPQFIKAATVSRAFREHHSEVQEVLIHTGQHYDSNMSDVFFDELDIRRPDFHLGIGGGSHGQNTGRMIEKIESVLMSVRPDCVLVYGDTDSTLAGALAAVKLHIPLVHVEAGLRSFNRQMPEEINRVLTDHIADLLFSPTDAATHNLTNEGITGSKVQQVGDVMYDAALYYRERAGQSSRVLDVLGLAPKTYILATIHRAENTDDPMRMGNILTAFGSVPHTIIFPMHPRTRNRLVDFGMELPNNVRAIDPVGYLDMVMLEMHATLIATDSGGIQKEAYFHGVPCVTLREETEWVELVEAGVNRLVSANPTRIEEAIRASTQMVASKFSMQPYGDGRAAFRIADYILRVVEKNGT